VTEAEWLGSSYPIVSLEAEWSWPSPRKQRLFAVACCRRIPRSPPERPVWRQALAVAQRYAERQAKRPDLKAAEAALVKGKAGRYRADRTYADLLAEFTTSAIRWSCEPSRRTYAGQAAISAAAAVAYAALPPDEPYVSPGNSRHHRRFCKVEKVEKGAQVALLCGVCGHPFRPMAVRVGTLAPEVIGLAQAAYEDRLVPSGNLDATRLAVLADAVEESGCADAGLLGHLRGPGPHVRGCWALDLLLGKK
jgi:hypothetical protein